MYCLGFHTRFQQGHSLSLLWGFFFNSPICFDNTLKRMHVYIYGRGTCTIERRLRQPCIESERMLTVMYPDQSNLIMVTLGEPAYEIRRHYLPRYAVEESNSLSSVRVFGGGRVTVEHSLLSSSTLLSVELSSHIKIVQVLPSARVLESITCHIPGFGTILLGGLTVKQLDATVKHGKMLQAKVLKKATLQTTGKYGEIRVQAPTTCIKTCSGDALVDNLVETEQGATSTDEDEDEMDRKEVKDRVIRRGRNRSRSRSPPGPRSVPVAPVFPVDPIGPLGPVAPTGPVAPVEPLPLRSQGPPASRSETHTMHSSGSGESSDSSPSIEIRNPSKVSMKDELTESKRDQCYVCYEHVKRLMNVECSHLQVCFTCVKQLLKPGTKCMICRTPVNSWQVVC
jgi:hypothetical protein